MPRACSICTNERHVEIDIDLAAKVPHSILAEKYEVTASALYRHSQAHLAESVIINNALVVRGNTEELIAAGLTTDQKVINQMLAETVATAREIQSRAHALGNDLLALNAIKEVRNSLALIEKFTAKAEGDRVDEAIVADFEALVKALRTVLPDHRDAARELAIELRLHGSVHLATTLERVLILEGEALNG